MHSKILFAVHVKFRQILLRSHAETDKTWKCFKEQLRGSVTSNWNSNAHDRRLPFCKYLTEKRSNNQLTFDRNTQVTGVDYVYALTQRNATWRSACLTTNFHLSDIPGRNVAVLTETTHFGTTCHCELSNVTKQTLPRSRKTDYFAW